MDLGASPFKVFTAITLTIIMPAISSGWLLAHVEDGKIIKITDNPNGTPYMKGVQQRISGDASGLRSGPAFETFDQKTGGYLWPDRADRVDTGLIH